MLLLSLKVGVAPLLVLLGSLAQRRFGPVVGGRIIGLPLTSLPMLALLTLSQGRDFAGSAASATLAAGVAQSLWALTYVVASRRWTAGPAALSATGVFATLCLVLDRLPLPLVVAAVLSAASIVGSLLVWPSAGPPDPAAGRGSDDLLARMVAAAAFTFVITQSASIMGARSAGLVGALPVISVILAVGIHRRDGSDESNRFLEGVMEGSLSVVAALAVLAFLLPTFGPALAFPAAIGASLGAQMIPMARMPRIQRLDVVRRHSKQLA
jgi:hypothetical protein